MKVRNESWSATPLPLDEEILERMLGYQWQERLPPICPECGYNLTGLPDNRCPECGYVYSRRDIKRNAQIMIGVIRQLRDVNEVMKAGMYIGIIASVVLIATRLLGGGAVQAIGRVLAVFAGLPTIGLGLQVFRVKQLPVWAQEFVPIKPNYTRAILVTGLGVLLIVLSVVMP